MPEINFTSLSGSAADDPTIVCDGDGGYTPVLNGGEDKHCGVAQCLEQHEQSHIDDWQQHYGECPGPLGSAPPSGGPGAGDFFDQSECKAYKVEMSCLDNAYKSGPSECRPYLQQEMEKAMEERDNACQTEYP